MPSTSLSYIMYNLLSILDLFNCFTLQYWMPFIFSFCFSVLHGLDFALGEWECIHWFISLFSYIGEVPKTIMPFSTIFMLFEIKGMLMPWPKPQVLVVLILYEPTIFIYIFQNLICGSEWTTNPTPFHDCMSIGLGNTYSEFCDSPHLLNHFHLWPPWLPMDCLCLSLCLLNLMGKWESWRSCLICGSTSRLELSLWSKRYIVRMDM